MIDGLGSKEFLLLIQFGVVGVLERVPAVMGYTLDKLPVNHSINIERQLFTLRVNSNSPINLTLGHGRRRKPTGALGEPAGCKRSNTSRQVNLNPGPSYCEV